MFLKEINETTTNDEIVSIKISNKRLSRVRFEYFTYHEVINKIIELRVAKFCLDNGTEETLISNVFDKTINIEDFKKIYNMRWNIETKYDDLKNKLQIENFSGELKCVIEQDFYCTIFLNNIAECMRNELSEDIQDENTIKQRKYEYTINMNILIGNLKNKLVCIFLEPNSKKRMKMFNKLTRIIKRNVVPIRIYRKVSRSKHSSKNKYSLNKRKCL